MRTLPILIFLSMFSLSAQAQSRSDPPATRHARLSWEQHFAQANASHDGHLTLAQAKSGYATLARHFQDIDASGKGYVTEDDIRAWRKQQRAARHAAQSPPDDPLRPRQAMHRVPVGQSPGNMPRPPVVLMAPDATVPSDATH